MPILRREAALLLRFEWVWIALMIFAYWHISPPIRDRYVFLLVFALPFYALRLLAGRRLFSVSPLDLVMLLFIPISIYNFHAAPMPRQDYLVVACRYFLGFFIVFYFVEHARQHKHIRYLMLATILLGILTSLVALTASQWQLQNKTQTMRMIADLLPRLDYRQVLPDMRLSFNPNEIAGAVSYFCPFMLAVFIGTFVDKTEGAPLSNRLLRRTSLIGFALSLTALMLDQSRFALAGIGIALLLALVLLVPDRRLMRIALAIWSLLVAVNILLFFDTPSVDTTDTTDTTVDTETSTTAADDLMPVALNQRNQHSLSIRFEVWESARRIIEDYPATGSGISTYRSMVRYGRYAVYHYTVNNRLLPHAHNAFLQMGADLGVPGLLLFLGWYGVVGWMALKSWRGADSKTRALIVAAGGGILAHLLLGIGDAIPFWDRFAFLHWWFIGLMAALYILTQSDNRDKIDAGGAVAA